jgi:hypothetical protein
MKMEPVSEYNRDQLVGFEKVREGLCKLDNQEIQELRTAIAPYLEFRARLAEFNARHFTALCRETCFLTSVSACCGFESIFTFFADQVITALCTNSTDQEAMLALLSRPNHSRHCVYLGESGCTWKVPPIGCAMFFCDTAKNQVFKGSPAAESEWSRLRELEKEFTQPTRPVLFDWIEVLFRRAGIDSPHMYFHKSPGLLRMKAGYSQGKGIPTRQLR